MMHFALLFLSMASAQAEAANDAHTEMLSNRYAAGRCLVEKNGKMAAALLKTVPRSGEEMIAFAKADTKFNCFEVPATTPMRVDENVTRGVIVEALLMRDFSSLGIRKGKSIAEIFPIASFEKYSAVQGRMVALLQVAECATDAEPVRSFALFATTPGSKAEADTIKSLASILSSCAPAGVQLSLNISLLRTLLAEGAYRVSAQQSAKVL